MNLDHFPKKYKTHNKHVFIIFMIV